VPFLVNSFCDADKETERREYGAPRTSKRASRGISMYRGDKGIEELPAGSNDGSIELLITSPPMTGDSAVGVALIWIALRWSREARSFRTGL